jgi:hypothetical protein
MRKLVPMLSILGFFFGMIVGLVVMGCVDEKIKPCWFVPHWSKEVNKKRTFTEIRNPLFRFMLRGEGMGQAVILIFKDSVVGGMGVRGVECLKLFLNL